MCQYEQAEFLRLSRQKYRKKSPKRLVTQGDRTFFHQVTYFTKYGCGSRQQKPAFFVLGGIYYGQSLACCIVNRISRSSGVFC